jgi:hypothetical protein
MQEQRRPQSGGRNQRLFFALTICKRRPATHSLKNWTGDRTGKAFGSQFTGWTAGSNRFDVGFLVVKNKIF